MLNPESKVEPDKDLLAKLEDIGLSEEERQQRGFFGERETIMENIPVYMKMQRTISRTHMENPTQHAKIFAVIPIHNCQRKHIRLDKGTLHTIMADLDLLPRKIGKRAKGPQMLYNEFAQQDNIKRIVGNIFDLEKKERIGGKKKHSTTN